MSRGSVSLVAILFCILSQSTGFRELEAMAKVEEIRRVLGTLRGCQRLKDKKCAVANPSLPYNL